MNTIHAGQALLPDGWARDVRISVSGGRIAALQSGAAAQPEDELHATVIPGMPNVHSHAFQRGMAGMAERRGPASDSFWSWRDVMYRFALSMTPDQIEGVAAQLYVEMLEAGFTRVGEFHYLHHAPDGSRYDDIAEIAARVAAAAATAGIGLTLLPVFYARSGFGGAAADHRQRRFVCGLEDYARLLGRCEELAAALSEACVGVAPHSLRAVTPAELSAVAGMRDGVPIHIHIAEQTKEVEDCVAWCGQRPVEWLLANQPVDGRWCLIHATHISDSEARGICKSGAVAGLCPVTEANLGDGIFPAAGFITQGGRIGIGSDSNVLVGVADELRQLEYSQRLHHRSRNVLARPGHSTGGDLFQHAMAGGAAAIRAPAGLMAGRAADFVSLRHRHGLPIDGDLLLDSWIFSRSASVDSVWVHGRKQVADGRHRMREEVEKSFSTVMRSLLS